MRTRPTGRAPDDLDVDAEIGHRLIEVKPGVSGLRSVRLGLMRLAYAMTRRPDSEAFLVLPDAAVSRDRLEREWQLAASVLRPELRDRLSLCIVEQGRFIGIPRDPDPEARAVLSRAIAAGRSRAASSRSRGDAAFVVLKLLLHHWLTDGQPVKTGWLAKTSGYSYPTIAGVLQALGSLVERSSDRRLRLRWFSREEFARLVAGSNRARATVRFADRSGQSRPPESHLRRLQQIAAPDIAIGGVLGAAHYFPDLDLIGSPRLDLSQHCPKRPLDVGFITALDPALKRVEDPLEPATVVVHAVRHADPLFSPREGGFAWADPVECLLDLHEAHLETQAARFLEALQRCRPAPL